MRTVIVYKSKHGSTKEYAEYIKKNIPNSEIFPIETFGITTLDSYENIILGSSVYAGTTFLKRFLIDNWNILKGKKIFVFTVGMTSDSHPNSKNTYKEIPVHIRKEIQYIKLPGRIQFSKLNLFEKLIIKMIEGKRELRVEDMVDLQKANSVVLYFKQKE